MTDVGKIKLGVEIDADDLSAKLGEAVRRAIAPALEKIQRELNKVQREYDETAKASERSSARQVAALKRVQEQAVQTAAAVRAAQRGGNGPNSNSPSNRRGQGGGGSGGNDQRRYDNREDNRRIDQRKYDNRQYDNRKYDSSTTYDHRVYNYNGVPGNGPPGGGGNGGGRGGGGGGRGGGVLGFLTSPAGLSALSLGASALPAVATGVVNIVGAVQQLGQAGLALPGIFAGGAAVIGTAVIGFKGLGDAVKALNEADADPKKLEEANKALEKMAPAAAELAKEVSRLSLGPLKDFQKAIAQPLLDGVAGSLSGATDKLLPRAQAGMSKVATALNGTIKTALTEATSDKSLNLMDRIFGNTAEGQTRANAAIKPLLSAFGQLAATGSDFLPRLGDAITKVSERFDAFVTKNANNGNLFRWIDEGLNGLRSFGNAILNVGKIITGLTRAAGQAKGSLSGDGGFLGGLERFTEKWSTFINSDAGQRKLGDFFAGGTGDLAKWGDLLGNLGPILKSIIDGFAKWGDVLFPIVSAFAELLNDLNQVPGLLESIVVGFLAFRTISGVIGGLTGSIGGLTGALGGGAGGGGLIGKLGLLKGAAGAGGLVLGGNLLSDNDTGVANQAGGALANIGGAALIGSTFGPWGTAIGALVGAGVTLFEVARKQIDDGKAEWEKSWKEHHDAGPNREGSPERMIANNPALRGVMSPSQFNPDGSAKPTIAQDLPAKIAAGQLPGFSVGPDGLVHGPDGAVVNLPANLLPPGSIKPPPPPELPKPVQDQVTQGTPVQAGAGPSPIDAKVQGTAQAAKAAFDNVQLLTNAVNTLPSGEVVLKDNAPEAIKRVQDLGYAVQKLPNGQVAIAVQYMYNGAPISLEQLRTPIRVAATPGGTAPTIGGGRATGGPIWGGIKGVDSVPIMAQHGEFVLDTGDVARMGGVAGVEQFRRGLESGAIRRFAEGGPVIGEAGTGLGPLPGPPTIGPDTELSVLISIRDLLGGKGGAASNPLAATAANTATSATAAKGGAATGAAMGPFGTPLKQRNLGYDMAAAAIQALGGDPEAFIGSNPATVAASAAAPGGLMTAQTGTLTGSTVDVAALQKFAQTGNTADLPAGLTINSPAVTAILAARNKAKGGLSDQGISDLVGQALGPGGYSGTLDTTNTSLVKALEKLRTKGVPGTPAAAGGYAATASATGVPMTSLPGVDAAILSQIPKGSYSNGPGDLTKGLADCSSAVEDLVNIIDGKPTAGRSVNTGNEVDWLLANGFVQNTTGANVPGALNIGLNAGHTQATLPGGTNFNWGSDSAAAAGGLSGDGAFGAGLTQQFYRMVNGAIPGGMTGAGMSGGGLGGGGGAPVPVYIVAGPGGQLPGAVKDMIGAGLSAAGGAAGTVATDITGAIGGLGQEDYQKRNPNASLDQLVKERNPLALANAAGINVEDFSRAGGAFDPSQIQKNDQKYTASGQLLSDTSGLADRTFTDLQAQLSALREQLVDAIEQTNKKLTDTALEPVIKAGLQSGLESLKDSVSTSIGGALGQAAAPPIADAVSQAVSQLPIDQSGAGNTGGAAAAGNLGGVAAGITGIGMAGGGPVSGGTAGKDSVPAMLMPGEYVLNTGQVAKMGGFSAVDNIASKGMRHYAAGGGVIANDTVGAEFFGVSEVPIIGAIINTIIRVLLQVIGVQIEARDTLNEMTDEFRGFRGDAFKAFDAQGRLLNDTSGLIERTQSSQDVAAEERIRILKIVIQAIIKYLIEKVIVPITKAVANAAISAAGSAAGAATNVGAPGAGGIVSSLITSGGQAGVEIAAEVGTDFALAISDQLINVVAEGLQSAAPDLVSQVFGGGFLAQLFDPAGGFLTTLVGGLFGAFAGLLGGGLFGGASTLIPGIPFDQGGLATGKGLMLKDTDADELVLKPGETDLFSRFVKALENGGFSRGQSTHVSAPITVIGGGRETAEQVENRLLKLMP